MPPLTTKNLPKRGKKQEKDGKIGEKEEKSGRRFFHFDTPDRAGYAFSRKSLISGIASPISYFHFHLYYKKHFFCMNIYICNFA